MIHEILFPGLGLSFSISKTAFTLFGISVAWYAVLIVLSFIIALFLFYKRDGLYGISKEHLFELMFYILPIAFIGARAYYVLFRMDYYLQNPDQIFNLRGGGLAIYGGIIAGAIVCYVFAKKKKIALGDLLDYIVPALALGQAIGRWGNFINVEAYGTETTSFLRMGIFENGIYQEVHPTFLYESIVDFVLFLFLLFYQKKRKFRGEITYLYLIFYCLARFFIEGIRTDSLMLGNYRISQVLSAIVFVIFCGLFWKKRKEMKKTEYSKQ